MSASVSDLDTGKGAGSLNIEQGPVDESSDKERQRWYFSDFARGPDTICWSVWGPAMLALIAADQTCSSFQGVSSGAEGKACTADDSWNNTLWLSPAVNGSNCHISDITLGIKNTQDTNLPGCADALTAYRSVKTSFTCNCTGDYAYLPLGGARVGNILVTQLTINSAIIAVCILFLGPYIDYAKSRKNVWKFFWVLSFLSSFGAAIIGSNYIWLVGMVFASCTHLFTELMILPILSFLSDLAHNDDIRKTVMGMRLVCGFGAQIIFAMILGGMNFVIKDSSLKASIGVVLAGVWMAVFMLPSLSGVKEREAKLERSPDQTLLDITVKELWKSTKTMWTDYPEAFKYLFGHAFAKSGIQTILIINVTYFNQQMSLTGFQILIISVTVLFNGTFSAWAFSKFAKKFSTKKIWIFLESFWIVTILLTVLFMHKKGDLFMAILIGGGMYGFGLSWYFSVSYQGFDAMVPRNKATQFAGLFYFVGLCVSTLAPAIYSAVVQYTNNQRYALVTLIPWNFLGLITFMFIDFEKGKKTAGRF